MSELLIVIPARGGSKRLPRKNLRPLGGSSLLERTHGAVGAAGLAVPCLLSTDDQEIACAGRKLGWMVPFLRPAELAADDAPTLFAVMHALDWFAEENGGDPAFVMVLQATSPFRGGESLRQGVDLLKANENADAVLGVAELHCGAKHVYRPAADGFLEPLQGGREQTPAYVPNGALYLVRTAALRRHETLFPPRMLPLVMDTIASIDVDTELDWQLAEAVIASGLRP